MPPQIPRKGTARRGQRRLSPEVSKEVDEIICFSKKVFMASPSSSSATSQKMTTTTIQSRTKIRNLTTRWGERGSLGQIASTT